MALRIRIDRPCCPLESLFSHSSSDGTISSTRSSKGASSDPQPLSISSHFHDVKARLKKQQQHPPPPFFSRPLQQRQPPPRNSAESIEEIRTRLSVFQRLSAPPPPSSPSFQEIYHLNAVVPGRENESAPPNAVKVSLDKIRESLRGITDRKNANPANRDGPGSSSGGGGDRMSLSKLTDSLRLRSVEGDNTASSKSTGGIGKGDSLPLAIFGREIREKNEAQGGKVSDSLARTQFLRSYDYEELGEKLRNLRDVDGGKKGFSLEELNERLARLQEMEEKAMEPRSQNNQWSDLRETLLQIKNSEDEKAKKNTREWSKLCFYRFFSLRLMQKVCPLREDYGYLNGLCLMGM